MYHTVQNVHCTFSVYVDTLVLVRDGMSQAVLLRATLGHG